MPSVQDIFKKRKALITYITAGDPGFLATEKLIFQLEKSGADIIELGVPFSDPLADGPIIQASHQRALKKNASLADVFKLVGRARKKTQIPICLMLSYNLVLQFGEEEFYLNCDKFGINGVIIPDLPPEEAEAGNPRRVDSIFLVAPTSTDERINLAAEKSSGFIYLVSATGITGIREKLGGGIDGLVKKIRKYSSLPIAVGFGVSTPSQAAEIVKSADGIIVGSAIVDLIAKKKLASVSKLTASLRKAIDAC